MYNTLCSRNEIYEYVRGCETRGVDCEVAAAWIGGRGRWYGACLLLLACQRLIRGSFLCQNLSMAERGGQGTQCRRERHFLRGEADKPTPTPPESSRAGKNNHELCANFCSAQQVNVCSHIHPRPPRQCMYTHTHTKRVRAPLPPPAPCPFLTRPRSGWPLQTVRDQAKSLSIMRPPPRPHCPRLGTGELRVSAVPSRTTAQPCG